MASPYSVTITNGNGTEEILQGDYTVTASVTGYDNSTITPSSVTVESGTTTYAFTIAADGTLTLHVTEDGTSTGTPIVGATFIRADSSGNTYGTIITTDSSGNAVFANVPYAASGAPTIYYLQTASDGNHEYDTTLQSTTLTSQTGTVEVTNASPATSTITLTDTNYTNLPIDNGTITLTSSTN